MKSKFIFQNLVNVFFLILSEILSYWKVYCHIYISIACGHWLWGGWRFHFKWSFLWFFRLNTTNIRCRVFRLIYHSILLVFSDEQLFLQILSFNWLRFNDGFLFNLLFIWFLHWIFLRLSFNWLFWNINILSWGFVNGWFLN